MYGSRVMSVSELFTELLRILSEPRPAADTHTHTHVIKRTAKSMWTERRDRYWPRSERWDGSELSVVGGTNVPYSSSSLLGASSLLLLPDLLWETCDWHHQSLSSRSLIKTHFSSSLTFTSCWRCSFFFCCSPKHSADRQEGINWKSDLDLVSNPLTESVRMFSYIYAQAQNDKPKIK